MLEAPEGQVTGGNWATRTQAEVDGIAGHQRDDLTGDWTVYPRSLLNVIQDHPAEESKCAFCSRVDLVETETGMHVRPMCPTLLSFKPYRWLA